MRFRSSRITVRVAIVLLCFLCALLPRLSRAESHGLDVDAGANRSSAGLLPAGAVAGITLHDGDRAFASTRDFLDAHGLFRSAPWTTFLAQPNMQPLVQMLPGFLSATRTDLDAAVGALLGRDLTIAFHPEAGGTGLAWIAASVPRDADRTRRVVDQLLRLAGLASLGKGGTGTTIREIGEHQVVALGPQLGICMTEEVLYIASGSKPIEHALTLARNRTDARLVDAAAHDSARRHGGPTARAHAFIDVDKLRDLGVKLTTKMTQPLGAFLFGGWWHHIVQGDSVSLALNANGRDLSLRGAIEGAATLPADRTAFLTGTPGSARRSTAGVDGVVADIVVTRAWADLFAERESLLDVHGASKVAEFATNISTLMGGFDFLDDFLPGVAGPVRFLTLHRTEFPAGRDVTPKLPAFVLVGRLAGNDRAGLAQRIETAAMMTFSFLNYEAAKKNQTPLQMNIDAAGGTRILTTSFLRDVAADDDASTTISGIRYNFEPAVTVVDDHLIIASTAAAARAVAKAYGGGTGRATPTGGDHGALDLRLLGETLRANREELIAQRMLEEDVTQRQAAGFFDALFDILGYVRAMTLQSHTETEGAAAELRLNLSQPDGDGRPQRTSTGRTR